MKTTLQRLEIDLKTKIAKKDREIYRLQFELEEFKQKYNKLNDEHTKTLKDYYDFVMKIINNKADRIDRMRDLQDMLK
jgi:FtsZ-binding cell division protein ZapB